MSSLRTFRHEIKFNITRDTMYNIRDKLKDVLDVDRSIDGYSIRSLYFDSIDDIDYYEKQDGAVDRKKIRLRIYDPKSNYVKLELKAKHDVHQLKESLIIDKDTANKLIDGNYDVLLNYSDDVAYKIYLIMRENCYIPKNIIEYKRIAFISKNNTRITLDYDIRGHRFINNNFFDNNINYLNVVPSNQVVLEVKFDSFLEDHVSNILSKYISNKESFSKYVMSRNKE